MADVVENSTRPRRNRRRRGEIGDSEALTWRTWSGRLELMERSIRRRGRGRPRVVRDVDPVVGLVSVIGRRAEMEDTVKVKLGLCSPWISGYRPVHFFGVFDGHGGSHFSIMCKEKMNEILEVELMRVDTTGTPPSNGASNSSSAAPMVDENVMFETWRRVFTYTYKTTELGAMTHCACGREGLICSCDDTNIFYSGTTAVVVVLTDHHIVIANCGDSRAVLCRAGRDVQLSFDHKPDRADEKIRIESCGGHVINMDTPRVEGILAMSRAIGDSFLKPSVTSEPEVTFMRRDEEDEFIILASDGLWDVISNEMACRVTRECLREPDTRGRPSQSTYAASLLTRLALAKNSSDNISVVIVDLK